MEYQNYSSLSRKLEKTLEVTLAQLKSEQGRRKQTEKRLGESEWNLKNSKQALQCAEEAFKKILDLKDNRITELELQLQRFKEDIMEQDLELSVSQSVVEDDEHDFENSNLTVTDNKNLEKVYDENFEETGYLEVTDENDSTEGTAPTSETNADKKSDNNKTVETTDIEAGKKIQVKEEKVEQFQEYICADNLQCKLCGKKFKSRGSLKSHKEKVHDNIKPFKCSKCERRFNDVNSMRRHEVNDKLHRRLESEKLNPFLLCCICGKQFDRNRRWCLDQHLRTHLAATAVSFPCPVCGKIYTKEACLVKHVAKAGCGIKQESVE